MDKEMEGLSPGTQKYQKDRPQNILNYDIEELKEIVVSLGDKAFRAKQIFGWLAKGVESFEDMHNIPNSLIEKLKTNYYIGLPEVVVKQTSEIDGTVKCLFEFADGARVESVLMRYEYGNAICISSQAGCRMGCKFCASTMNGLERNLTGGEMLGEILKMGNVIGEDIGHIVIMGMGEPFDNYEEVSRFFKLVHDEQGYNCGLRNITLSTCGLIPQIRRFTEEFPQVNLAISLHAPNDEIRKKIMPVANKYSYDELISVCREHTEKTGRRVTFEYSMIEGVNDSLESAFELANKLAGWRTHVNLIPLNKVDGRDFSKSNGTNIYLFRKALESKGIQVTTRRSLGTDIDAACGQLRQRREK